MSALFGDWRDRHASYKVCPKCGGEMCRYQGTISSAPYPATYDGANFRKGDLIRDSRQGYFWGCGDCEHCEPAHGGTRL